MGLFTDNEARADVAEIRASVASVQAELGRVRGLLTEQVDELAKRLDGLLAKLSGVTSEHEAVKANVKVLADASNDHARRIDAAGSAVVVAADLAALASKVAAMQDDVDAARDRVFSHVHDFEPSSQEERAGRKRVIYKCRNCPTVTAFVEAG